MPELILAMILGYTIILIRGNLLVGEKNTRWLTGACLFTFIANVLPVRNAAPPWILAPDESVKLIGSASFGSLVLLATAIVIRTAVQRQEEQFHESQLALAAERRAAAGQVQFEHLRTITQRYIEYMAEVARGNLSARLTLREDADGSGRGLDNPLIVLGHGLNETVASFQSECPQRIRRIGLAQR